MTIEIIVSLIRLGVLLCLIRVGLGLLKLTNMVVREDTPTNLVVVGVSNKLFAALYLCTAAIVAFI